MTKLLGVRGKLVAILLFFGLVPALSIAAVAYYSTVAIEDKNLQSLAADASNLSNVIDRNLFERYGDVQAFTLNTAINDRTSWYSRNPAENQIAKVMDQYNTTYGCYFLSILVDTSGKVIAVNSRDSSGEPIDTGFIYDRNYASSSWFTACMNGDFYTSMPFAAEGNDTSTGTYVEDLHLDSDVAQAYPDEDELTLGFSAPVYDDNGTLIAIWSNRARFSLVEEMIRSAYVEFKSENLPKTEITLLDAEGNVIVDYDPTVSGTEEVVHDLDNVLFKLNLAEAGVVSAEKAVAGERGSCNSIHKRKQIEQSCGFAHLDGALGFPGMNWGVMIRLPRSDYSAAVFSTRRNIAMMMAGYAGLILLMGWFVGSRIAGNLKGLSSAAREMANGDFRVTVPQINSKDELGQLGSSMAMLCSNTRDLISRVEQAVSNVASSSEELAASADETNNSTREITQTISQVSTGAEETTRNIVEVQETMSNSAEAVRNVTEELAGASENAKMAVHVGNEGKQNADAAVDNINRAAESLRMTTEVVNSLGTKTHQISDFINIITGIADQTNLLALNAAIEAARAGDAGRGFAVVAEEVRKLAEESNSAAINITKLVQGIELEMNETLEAMNKSDAEVGSGAELVMRTSEMLEKLVMAIGEVSNSLVTISASAEQITASTADVVNSMQSVSAVAQQNSASCQQVNAVSMQQSDNMQEISSCAGSLAQVSQELQHVVQAFKI